MINSRFDKFTEIRELPTLREMIPKRRARCGVKLGLLITRLGVDAINGSADSVAIAPGHISGIHTFEQKGYDEVFANALHKGVVAQEHIPTVEAYLSSGETK